MWLVQMRNWILNGTLLNLNLNSHLKPEATTLDNTALHINLNGYCHFFFYWAQHNLSFTYNYVSTSSRQLEHGPLENMDLVTWIYHFHIHIQWRL